MKNTNLLCWNSSKQSLDKIPFRNILDLSLLCGVDDQISKIKKTLKISYKATPIIMLYFGELGVVARVALYEEC